jgi:Family of unknown function (DUF6526)
MATTPQSYATHRRIVPGYHLVAGGLIALNLVASVVVLARGVGGASIRGFVQAVILLLLAWYVRTFPLAVQNRVICLEERLRLARLAPPDLLSRAAELTAGQLIALRFASDGELVALTRQVLDESLTDREAIKKRIVTWRPDTQRV